MQSGDSIINNYSVIHPSLHIVGRDFFVVLLARSSPILLLIQDGRNEERKHGVTKELL